jgi:PAS domain-containing protein
MAENAMELDMDEQDEMQLVADSLAPDDFGIGQLFWEIRDAVVVGDVETGRIVLWNPAAAALFEIPVAEA